MDQLRTNCRALWRRFRRASFELHGAFPRHGLRTADLPRESARHRNLFAGQPEEAVRHGLSHASQTFDAGRCQRRARLAHLGRVGDGADVLFGARANCIATRISASISPIRSTLWMPRPSTCACRCFRGHRFVLPKRRSRCIPCWICAATFRLSSISRTEKWAMSTCWISCLSKRVRSM